jgi:hypothetical protein
MRNENEEPQDKEDARIGRLLSEARSDRYLATKDLFFETEPEEAALRYPFDKRSIEILGLEKWQELFGSEDD